MNRYTLSGRLVRDPELRTLPSDNTVCNMRLAVDGMGPNRSVGYVDVATFGKQAEAAAKVLSKGWLVAVDGRLAHRTWKDAENRHRESYTVIGHVEFLRAPRAAADADQERADEAQPDADAVDDEIPF